MSETNVHTGRNFQNSHFPRRLPSLPFCHSVLTGLKASMCIAAAKHRVDSVQFWAQGRFPINMLTYPDTVNTYVHGA